MMLSRIFRDDCVFPGRKEEIRPFSISKGIRYPDISQDSSSLVGSHWRGVSWSLLRLCSLLSVTAVLGCRTQLMALNAMSLDLPCLSHLNLAGSGGEREDGMESSDRHWPHPPKIYRVPTMRQSLSSAKVIGVKETLKVYSFGFFWWK